MDKNKQRERDRRYRERNKEAKRARDKAYYEANKDAILSTMKQTRTAQGDTILSYEREMYRKHNTARQENAAAYYAKRQQSILEDAKTKHRSNLLARWIKNIGQRSKRSNIPFDLTVEYVQSIMPSECPVLKHPFITDGTNRDYMWSLDRIVPDLGYVIGNVNVISWKANRLRSNASADELKAVYEYAATLVHSLQVD